MHIFARRRKESSQPPSSAGSPPGGSRARGGITTSNALSILSASLPRSYRQQNGSRSSSSGASAPPGLQKASDAALPATPTSHLLLNATAGNENAAPAAVKARAHHATAPAAAQHGLYTAGGDGHVSELGQMQHARPSVDSAQPAFMVNRGGAGKQSLPPIPRDSSPKRNLALKALPNPKVANRRMSTGSIPSLDAMLSNNKVAETAELQLCYGYWPIETQLEFNLVQIEEIVRLCGEQIRSKDIEAPLLFSTQALDISMEGICSLIRSYLSNRDIWRRDLLFAMPHDLCGMIKWALGRYVNPQGGRGFLVWETYERWRFGEREKDFPPRYITTHMLHLLPTHCAALFTTLFSLLTSALAYTTKNGCTVRKLATLFSSYIFGLPDDGTFEHTYTAYNRFSHATEHLLLAYVRDLIYQHQAGGAVTALPVRLCNLVKDYAQNLPTNLNKPPQGSDLQVVVRIRRHVRWYSKNLIASAGTWEVPRSKAWALLAPIPQFRPDGENKPSPFAYSSRYKHLLNIRGIVDESDEEDMQKFSSMVEKEWKSFMQSGFAPPDNAKLRFDLTESDRVNRRKKHETIDWTTFESSGFQGRESYLEVDLNFNPGINDPFNIEDLLSEARAKLMAERARNIEKSLPPFNYDITPREERSVQIDKQFLEVYSDVLCSSGWAREEVKESSWALIQFKTRPKTPGCPVSAGSDGRTEETWFLVEELVPADYRASLLEKAQCKPKSSRRISFLRPVRKKQSKQSAPALPDISKALGLFNRSSDTVNRNSKAGLSQFRQSSPLGSASLNLKTPDDSVFVGGPTKIIKLSNSILSPGISKASSLNEEGLEAIDASTDMIDRSEVDHDVGGSQNGHASLNYAKPHASTASGFLDMVPKTTRRTNRPSLLGKAETPIYAQDQSIPDSPASTVVPGSPGFNLSEHGVNGPGRPIDHPNDWMDRMARMSSANPDLGPQRYERSPASHAGTSRSIETRVTSGHSHTSGPKPDHLYSLECLPSSDSRDSASIYDRDLPDPPMQCAERPFSSATRDAEELVAAYSRHDRSRASVASKSHEYDDVYDGLASEQDTFDGHQEGDLSHEATFSTSQDLPSPPVQGLSAAVPSLPSKQYQPVSVRKPLRSVSHDSRDNDRNSKPLPSPHDVQELLKSPVVPVNGTGKVGNLASRFGGTAPRSTS